ncbi:MULTISPECIES: TetR/AcrR family transcriptional regulator [Halococcus]|uniref:DNA-binding transcriptional regulator n=1 Tax=Halococcus salifodinae DSM 8989 TaxID=1227456 RepID=M0NCN5_9EURY|nr:MULTISPECIES: TetR/AcrR family transcriptional regulator [Halococcus]EMA55596.1 DNA-binding transcriptional regulator [Halococcus salifodinae DSM 8989]
MSDTTTDETAAEIMDGTYRALCEHGYAALRMQDIADETTKSKAALHYHYDSKHDLLLSFLDHLIADFSEKLGEAEGETPPDRLRDFVGQRLTARDREAHQEFQTAILEIKAQAPYETAYRDRLERFDEHLHAFLRTILAEGVAEGYFDAALDPDRIADFFVTTIDGAETRHVAVEQPIEDAREYLLDHIDETLVIGPEEVTAE